MDADRFLTHSLRDPRITRILAAALDAVEPGAIVREYLSKRRLPAHRRLFLLGIGKASEWMTLAAADRCDDFAKALIVTKHALRQESAPGPDRERVAVMEAGHPIPDERSLVAGHAVLDFVARLNEDDLLLCLLSGGGSALVTAPRNGISIEDMKALTTALLSSGATIDEINILRRQLDRVKGGGLASATKARIVSLILSDVIGDHLEAIASGPTAPNPTNNKDALAVLEKYGIRQQVPKSIPEALNEERQTNDSVADHVQNVIIGNNAMAMGAAQRQAEQEGFDSKIISTEISGEASEVGSRLSRELKEERGKRKHPFCWIAGGETTVTLYNHGKGGRNQELALAAVDELDRLQDVFLVALATDGDDGPTDAGGAVVNAETRQRAERLGMSASDYLSRHDAYPFFESLGDLLKPGYTGTNVNDLIFLIGF